MKKIREIIAILPSAGVGSRMGAGKAKQYCMLKGKTILEHSLNLFLTRSEIKKIIVAVSKDDPYLADLPFFHHPKIQWVEGGETRAKSVLNALNVVQNPKAWVLVHDVARPCISWQVIQPLLAIEDEQGGILAIPVVDTLKKANAPIFDHIFHTVDRRNLWQAQTPQFFPLYRLKKALQQALEAGVEITDEASAMEWAGFQPRLVLGSRYNIKLTYPEDLHLAEFYFSLADKERSNV